MTGGGGLCATLRGLEEVPDWDARIGRYPQKRIFHESVWLRFLEADQGGHAVALELRDTAGREAGLWPGVVIRKGPVRVFGSPLRGWGTVAMGPLYDPGRPDGLVPAAERALREAGIHHWEFVSETLALPSAPAGYRFESSDTHRIPLAEDESRMWAHLQQRCRTATRKAVREGLTAAEPMGEAFLEDLLRMVRGVFARRGSTPPYDSDRLRRLWRALHPAGKAFGLVVAREGEIAAAGIFISDGVETYAWSEASDPRFKSLGPNNLLYWEAMRAAARRGARALHLPGAPGSPIGKFKASFNPEVLQYPFWIRDRSRLLRWGRRFYQELATLRARWRYLRAPRAAEPPGKPGAPS